MEYYFAYGSNLKGARMRWRVEGAETCGAGFLDDFRWRMASYYYEDYRSYWSGLRDRDRLGKKENVVVTAENHSNDF